MGDGKPGDSVLPYQKPTVKVDKSGLEARLVIHPVPRNPPEPGFWRPSLAEIESVLKESGVLAPMDQASMNYALDRVGEGRMMDIIAAKGRPAEPGKDGWLELLVDLDAPSAPAQVEDGHVDLKSSGLIRNVKAGQPLAVVHPPAVGRAGLDVYGKLVPSQPGKSCEVKLGANVRRAEKDPNLILAATEGNFRRKDGRLEVEECFQVPGDVDYASGNIAFAKSVFINGDVKSGFAVDAGGDVEVQGMVEDCVLKALGSVFIRGGFAGSGKGRIDARGDVSLAHLRNQTVRCEGHVTVAREAVNSRILSRGQVTVNGLLAGGRTQALKSIQCQTAGTETGTPTLLEAGCDFTVSEEMAAVRKELEEMLRYARKLEDGLKHLNDLERVNRGLERWSIEMVFETERMKAKVDAKTAALRARFSELETLVPDEEGAVITVRRKAFPGTVIKIGQDVFRVEEALEGPRSFRSRQGLIEVCGESSAHPAGGSLP